MSTEEPTEPDQSRLAQLADEIRTEMELAERLFATSLDHAMNAGDCLLEAQTLVQRGMWSFWLKDNFNLTSQTARTYMRVAANRERVEGLPTIRAAMRQIDEGMLTDDPRPEGVRRLPSETAAPRLSREQFDPPPRDHDFRRSIDQIASNLRYALHEATESGDDEAVREVEELIDYAQRALVALRESRGAR